jgi:MYXO-CTERM domain-containing protein
MIAEGFRAIPAIVAFAAALSSLGGTGAWATTYIFSTFKGDDAAGMKLSVYTSTDALGFTLLSDTGFGGNTTYLRDPSIMKHTDGRYYLAYTDPMTASCCNPEDHLGIAVSTDLIHWTDLATVKAGVPAVSRVWAPEWFVEGGVVRIIANIDTGSELPDFQPYIFTAEDGTLTSWSAPTVMGIGADYIDTFVAKLGATYHAFVKNDLTRYLEHATAPSLTGPWTFVGKGDWAGWGSGMEGPAIVQLDDGMFRMFVDPQSGGTPCQYMTSSDLNTWSARASIPGVAGGVVRHGTVIRDMAGHGSNGDFSSVDGGLGGYGGNGGNGGDRGNTGNTGSMGNGGSAGAFGQGGTKGTGGLVDAGAEDAGGRAGAGGAAGAPNPGGGTSTDGPIGSGGVNDAASSTGGAGASSTFGTGGASTPPASSPGVSRSGCACTVQGQEDDVSPHARALLLLLLLVAGHARRSQVREHSPEPRHEARGRLRSP